VRAYDGLKSAVLKALDLLGAALDAALGLLEKGLLAMVDGYRAAVAGALRWAQSVVDAFAAFAALIKDIAANPRQWLANLAASAKDGVRNHLWKAFKAAIKQWFSDKVEEVLGLLSDVLSGLHYVHELTDVDGDPLDIVHRDVTPQNVLVSYDGSVKVVDFGIAFTSSRLVETRVGVVKGKLSFMSPEHARGESLDAGIRAAGLALDDAVGRPARGLAERRREVFALVPNLHHLDRLTEIRR